MLTSSFGPESLLVPEAEHLLCKQPSHAELVLGGDAASTLQSSLAHCQVNADAFAGFVRRALESGLYAVRGSYAPHSRSPSAVLAFYRKLDEAGDLNSDKTGDLKLAVGSYLENAAYNPSLPPLQYALTQVMLESGCAASTLRLVVLFEITDARISYAAETKAILGQIAPDCVFERVSVLR